MKQWALLAMLLGWSVGVMAEEVDPMKLRTIGGENATIAYVFTSAGCPHCAAYHRYIMPKLRRQFVQTNKMQLKIVDMPYDVRSFQAMQLARCMSAESYDRFMNRVYAHQSEWMQSPNSQKTFFEYAKKAGASSAEMERCWEDKALTKRMVEQRDNLSDLYRVQGMPTTVIVKGNQIDTFVGSDEGAVLFGIKKALKQ